MTTIARGSQAVRNLERALGGTPPKAAAQKARSDLHRHVQEHFKAQKRSKGEMARLADPLRTLMLRHIPKDDPKLRKHIEDVRAVCERRSKHKIRPPKAEKFEARFTLGSNFRWKVPPYDTSWSFPPDPRLGLANADATAGTYHLKVQSIGDGLFEVAAGLGNWFFALTDDLQRFWALIDYSDDWWDRAFAYVAHNDLRTRLWVWGASENGWVATPDVSPLWSDGVSWTEHHGNDPQGESARVSVETYFPVRPNNWYLAWVWSDAWVYADSGFWGLSASSIQFRASVPLVVFGSP
jgi:hypothetical protein